MITIADLKLLIKSDQPRQTAKIAFWTLVFILFGGLCFGLGRLATLGQGSLPVTIIMPPESQMASVASVPRTEKSTIPERTLNTKSVNPINDIPNQSPSGEGSGSGVYVGARTGKKYYLLTCNGVSRIKEENRVWFNTKAEAEAKGYTPAANCPGI